MEVDVPNSVTSLYWTPIFEWYVVRCASKNGYQKNMFRRDWTMCSKYENQYRLNTHKIGGTYMTT